MTVLPDSGRSGSPPKLPDFSARTVPIGARLARALNITLWWLVGTPVSKFAVSITVGVFVSIAVSTPIRSGRGFWLELLFVALFFAIREIVAVPYYKIIKTRWFQTFTGGRPHFGPLKGPGKQTFQFILRCFASVELHLEPEIEAIFRKVGDREIRVIEEYYRREYERAGYELSDWPGVWEQIQHAQVAGAEYGDVIRTNRWFLFFIKHYTVQLLVLPLSLLYTAGSFWLLDKVARGRSPLHLIQFALLAGFVIAFVIFINYTVSLRAGKLLGKEEMRQIRDELLSSADADTRAAVTQLEDATQDQELESELEPYAGRDFYPVISIRHGYIQAIRNEFVRDFLVIGCLGVLSLGLLLLIQWPIAHVLSHWTDQQVEAWTVKMLVGTAFIPIALIATLSLAFIVLSRFKKFAGVLATGLLLAVVPPVITYVLHGSVGNVVLISSVVTAAIGVLPSAIAELIKQKPNLEGTT